MAQGTEFPLTKPAGFHWDIFLLGLTTGISGILGLPFPNGLIPQAPFHTESLCVTVPVTEEDSDGKQKHYFKRTHVVEQRLSNLAQGLLTLVTMSPPLLVVLHLIPQAVLAGLFFIMGYQALEGNGITVKLLFLLREKTMTDASNPLNAVKRRGAIWAFVAIELFGFAATFAITQTVAAVGFPVIIFMLIPARVVLLPRFFTSEELGILDGPTAAAHVMDSVGGSLDDLEKKNGDSSASSRAAYATDVETGRGATGLMGDDTGSATIGDRGSEGGEMRRRPQQGQ